MLAHFDTRAQKVLFGALTGLLIGLVVAVVGSAAEQIGQPWPGFVVWRNLVAPAIGGPAWPGSRADIPHRTVVVDVGGVRVRDARELRDLVRTAPLGASLPYTFRRGTRSSSVEVPTSQLRWRDVLPVYLPYWICGVGFFAVGLVVFYLRPSLSTARANLALGVILGAVLILASDVFSSFWLDRLYFVCESLTAGALVHFALCFPEEKAVVRRHPWLKWAVYLPFVPLGLAQNAFLSADPERHLVANDVAYGAIAAAGLAIVLSLVHTFLTSRNTLARQQAKIAMAGAGFAAFVPSIGILAPIVLFGANVPMNLVAPFVLVYPLAIGYAIARHDLFSVDRYLRRGVVYAALSLVVFLTYAGVVLGAQTLLGAGRILPVGVVPAYVLLVLLLFDPLRASIQRGVDRLFYRQAVSYRVTVEATSRVLASVLDTERIASTVLDSVTGTMAIEWAALLLVGPEVRCFGRPQEKCAEVATAFRPGDPWLAAVTRSARPLTRYDLVPGDERRARPGAEPTLFDRLGVALALPVRFEAAPLGVLIVGEKRSGGFYNDDDVDLLETLVNQSALALTNARAYEMLRQTQAELVSGERMAAVGELAATVAHGIRNPLAGIRAAAQLVREESEPGSYAAESLGDIIAEADRVETRVRSILELTRTTGPNVVLGDLNRFLESFADERRQGLPEGIRLDLDLDGDGPPVRFDAVQLKEALDILVTNAVDAMRERGSIHLASRVERDGSNGVRVAIAVTDTGPGIDPASLPRVFELFYTTKPTGTGVGLAMAKRLVERQGGSIAVVSTPGKGATFTLYLPTAYAGSAATHES